MDIAVWGSSRLASALRNEEWARALSAESCVFVVDIDSNPCALANVADADIDRVWERPMRELVLAVVEAKRAGALRIVVVVPTIALSGGAEYALQSAVAEAARVFVKSAARQWGEDGVVINCVAIAPEEFGIDTEVSGEMSLAPRALPGRRSASNTIAWLCTEGASDVTGQTIVVDGGLWM